MWNAKVVEKYALKVVQFTSRWVHFSHMIRSSWKIAAYHKCSRFSLLENWYFWDQYCSTSGWTSDRSRKVGLLSFAHSISRVTEDSSIGGPLLFRLRSSSSISGASSLGISVCCSVREEVIFERSKYGDACVLSLSVGALCENVSLWSGLLLLTLS